MQFCFSLAHSSPSFSPTIRPFIQPTNINNANPKTGTKRLMMKTSSLPNCLSASLWLKSLPAGLFSNSLVSRPCASDSLCPPLNAVSHIIFPSQIHHSPWFWLGGKGLLTPCQSLWQPQTSGFQKGVLLTVSGPPTKKCFTLNCDHNYASINESHYFTASSFIRLIL